MATKAPSGLTITRNNKSFTFKWTRGETYDEQGFCYRVNSKGKQIYVTIGAGQTSISRTIDLDDFYPTKNKRTKKTTKLKKVTFWVRGHTSSQGWSSWSQKDYVISAPPKPKLSAAHSDNPDNQTTFSWNINWGKSNSKSSPNVFTKYKYWTVLKQNCDNKSDEVKGWGDPVETKIRDVNGSKVITESTVFSGNYSYTRFFMIQAFGPNGKSDKVYAKHVYAYPNAPQNVKANAVLLSGNAGYNVSVQWTAAVANSRPIDSVSVEYAIDTPITRYEDVDGVRKVLLEPPFISSWTTAKTIKDTSGADGTSFIVPGGIDNDKCIFVRVVTKHDNNISPSDTTFVEGGYGKLAPTSAFSATIDDDIATVSVTNGSSLAASFVAIYHRTSDNPDPQLVGISPAGNTAPISVQLPPSSSGHSLGAQAFLADYSPITPAVSGVTEYAITNIQASSEKIEWLASSIPNPPEDITLSSPKTGVVRVGWDWTWTDANGVELSWADHEDAWESTDGPQTYNLENTRARAWNVAGLSVGTWYFRVRLFKSTGDTNTYGTYSPINSIKLSQSPDTPVLTLADATVPPDGSITCYWAFTTTDGDEQAQAEIREVIMNSEGIPTAYEDIGVKADNEQYKTFSVADVGWEAGSTHYLAVKIITASGEESENWSIPRSITIVEPITAEITSTSLVEVGEDLELNELPLSITATGSDKSSPMTYIIERAEDYHLDRPDESEFSGFKEEVVALIEQPGVGDYILTTDTEVDSAKQYYSRSQDEPYTYTEVVIPPPTLERRQYAGHTGTGIVTVTLEETPCLDTEIGVTYNIFGTSIFEHFQAGADYHREWSAYTDILREFYIDYNSATNTIVLSCDDEEKELTIELIAYFIDTNPVVNPAESNYYEYRGVSYATDIDLDDLINPLDDGATYNIIAVAQDIYGQRDETYKTFTVNWTHQAVKPSALVEPDNDKMVVMITPAQPESGYEEGDVCDIYRLSADRPELIVQGAEFGTKYVDPYPTLGKFGGHRIVYRTINGDYITNDKEFAWTDYDFDSGDHIDRFATVIDYEEGQIVLPYDLSLSSKWGKDFTMTKYLGGSIEGDWNPAVERSGSVKTRVAVEYNPELITALRRLANYAGVCHIRTPDGSSFAANIEVSEDREERKINMLSTFSLEITKVDSVGFDGLPYDEWISQD